MPNTKHAPPFQQDLDGFERVTRAFARQAWDRGMPIWQDAGRGPVALEPPGKIPDEGRCKERFDGACLHAEPWISEKFSRFERRLRRKCVYLTIWGRAALHFRFTDGSNPFVKYGTVRELLPEIDDWSIRYELRPEGSASRNIACFMLRERCLPADTLFAPGP